MLRRNRNGAGAGSSHDAHDSVRLKAVEQARRDELRFQGLLIEQGNGAGASEKTLSREKLCEALQLELSPPIRARLFEVLKVDTQVDYATFQRVRNVLESPMDSIRQKTVFKMFDPLGIGRVSKTDFKKVMLDLLVHSTTQSFTVPSSSAASVSIKPIVQEYTNVVFTQYCSEEHKGMSYDEWLEFAKEDIEVSRLLFALDTRIRWKEISLRRRFITGT